MANLTLKSGMAAIVGLCAAGTGPVLADGAELVTAHCTGCHAVGLIEQSSGYTEDGWRELIGAMVDLSDSPDLDAITAHLAARYPVNERRKPSLVDGDYRIGFTEWVSPTPGQRTRDPVEAPDGSYWWAGQWGNLVGRIDPTSGTMKEFALPAGARPHTVTTDAAGGIWYTGNGNGTVGRLDPETGEITVYPMPDPAARDPHSAVVARNGMVWFTLQQSNRVGRLDPASGRIDLATFPRADSRPYGIKLNSEGVPFVASNGTNRLYRVDPESMEITAFALPDARTRVRRLAFASDDTVWYVNSSRGRIGHLDPATGAVREWPSPSGPRSHPYAIAVIDDVVWYNESNQRPEALVRFDPADETFQSWPIPSGGIHAGIVRHMRPTSDGNLLIHQSATGRVIRVNLGG